MGAFQRVSTQPLSKFSITWSHVLTAGICLLHDVQLRPLRVQALITFSFATKPLIKKVCAVLRSRQFRSCSFKSRRGRSRHNVHDRLITVHQTKMVRIWVRHPGLGPQVCQIDHPRVCRRPPKLPNLFAGMLGKREENGRDGSNISRFLALEVIF